METTKSFNLTCPLERAIKMFFLVYVVLLGVTVIPESTYGSSKIKHIAGPPKANPRSPINYLKFYGFEDDVPKEERVLGAEAALTHNFGVVEGTTPYGNTWQFYCEAGVFSLFQEAPSRYELVSSDFYFSLPLELKQDSHSWRFELYHVSSHLGDEFAVRTGRQRIGYSLEALRVLHFWNFAAGQRLYLGAEKALRIIPHVEPWVFEGGFGFEMGHWFLGANLRFKERNDYDPAITFQWLRRLKEGNLAIGFEVFDGPLPIGQFFREERRYAGIVFQFKH